jgi:hypothetical protein
MATVEPKKQQAYTYDYSQNLKMNSIIESSIQDSHLDLLEDSQASSFELEMIATPPVEEIIAESPTKP